MDIPAACPSCDQSAADPTVCLMPKASFFVKRQSYFLLSESAKSVFEWDRSVPESGGDLWCAGRACTHRIHSVHRSTAHQAQEGGQNTSWAGCRTQLHWGAQTQPAIFPLSVPAWTFSVPSQEDRTRTGHSASSPHAILNLHMARSAGIQCC